MPRIILVLLTLFPIVVPKLAIGAESRFQGFGPFKFGMSQDDAAALLGHPNAGPDPNDPEITLVTYDRIVNLGPGEYHARVGFYGGYAYLFLLNGDPIKNFVPPNPALKGNPIWCLQAFEQTKYAFARSYGRPDETSHPGEFEKHDNASPQFYSTTWWLSDGVQVVVSLTKTQNFCNQSVSLSSSRYAKPFVPKITP